MAMRERKPFQTLWLCVILVGVCTGCSIQEDITRLDLRLADLEARHFTMERRVNAVEQSAEQQEQAMRTQLAESRAELGGLKTDLAQLRGRIEESEYTLGKRLQDDNRQTNIARLESQLARSLSRLSAIETYLNLEVAEPPAAPGAEGPAPAGSTGQSGLPGKAETGSGVKPSEVMPPPTTAADPDAVYAAAKRDFDRGAMESARHGFEQLLNSFPKSKLAGNAQFWLGETYYREQWYEKAILEYQKVIENYADGNKVEASLLKQGLAFFNLGDKTNARLILKELIRKYPKSNEAQIAKQKVKETD